MKKAIYFPYKSYKDEYYPIIKIQVKGPSGFLETEAYVDSGASISIFLMDFAFYLGIDYKKGKITYVMVGDGSFIPVYLHKLSLKLGNYTFFATVGFSAHLGADFNLLGQKDIFDRLKVIFDKRKKVVIFQPY
ncbi:MAG: hypothetical protein NC834_06760 [Candidatus Omnitrophica bacterium]|nr:hypothetical protein [Candidatus Omnitrophota bacterium]